MKRRNKIDYFSGGYIVEIITFFELKSCIDKNQYYVKRAFYALKMPPEVLLSYIIVVLLYEEKKKTLSSVAW